MSTYAGKFLRINLTNSKTNIETIPDEIRRDFLGSRGFGIKYLYDEVIAGTDPLSPANKLLLLSGPLAGTNAQSCSRWTAYTKSPLTGTIMRAVGGGDFGAWMKWADLDFIIIEGKAEKPVYVYIEKNVSEIRDARELWGMHTMATQARLSEIHGDRVRTACIGPAAENLVPFSVIASGHRTASRGGVGTVMGSKNLKAVAINAVREMGNYNSEAFAQVVKDQARTFQTVSSRGFSSKAFGKYGTGSIEMANLRGYYPVRNFQYGVLDGFEKLTHRQFGAMTYKHTGCYSCMLHCGKLRSVSNGPYAGAFSEGPEYETIWSFTGPIDNNEIGITIAANALCDELGLDTISTGNTIGFAMELFERGLIDKGDTDGLELRWGDHTVVLPLITKMALREGFGSLLSQGTKRLAEYIGKSSMDFAMHAKGLELPGYDPRALKGQGFGFASSNTGGNQNYGFAWQEVFRNPDSKDLYPFEEAGKAGIVKSNQDVHAIADSATACIFPLNGGLIDTELLSKLLCLATEIPEHGNTELLMKLGERICNLERAFNVRDGFDRKDDTLPRRVQIEPLRQGPAEGQVVRYLNEFLDEYYDLRGWTRNGIPAPSKLTELGLGPIINDLELFY